MRTAFQPNAFQNNAFQIDTSGAWDGTTVLVPSKASGPAYTRKRHHGLVEEAQRARDAEREARELTARKLLEAQQAAAVQRRVETQARRAAEDVAARQAMIERLLTSRPGAVTLPQMIAPPAHADDDEEAMAMLLLS